MASWICVILFIFTYCGISQSVRQQDWMSGKPITHSIATLNRTRPPPPPANVQSNFQPVPPPVGNARSSFQTRIANGFDVSDRFLSRWPFQVALLLEKDNDRFFCGGSIISANYALTAAHCTINSTEIHYLLGAAYLHEERPGEIEGTTKTYLTHPEYNSTSFVNDIALVKFNNAIKFSRTVSPVRLPSKRDEHYSYAGRLAIVGGYGITMDNQKSVSRSLKVAPQTVITNDICDGSLSPYVVPSTLCAVGSLFDPFAAPCSGDSGGPLVIPGRFRWGRSSPVEIGLVSFGPLSCEEGLPNAYTRITSYLDFIGNNSDVKIH